MSRFFLPVLFMFLLLASPGLTRAEDPAPAGEKAAPEKAVEEKAAEEKKADEEKVEKKADTEEVPKAVKDHQKAAADVFEKTKKIAEGLKPEEQKHFFLIYSNYNMIGAVKMVQEDVGNAVQSCAKENPDMKEKLETRFKGWNDAVTPVVKESQANVDNMVIAQDYAKPAEIKAVFKGLDKTRKLSNAAIDKTYVTTKDACEYLLGQMDDTQENFVRLLRETLVSAPAVSPSAGEAEKKPEAKDEPKAVEKPEEKKEEEKPAAEKEKPTEDSKPESDAPAEEKAKD